MFILFDRVQKELVQYTGQQLFSLSKAILERMFGADEGARLYSKLLVQKNLSGVCFFWLSYLLHIFVFMLIIICILYNIY